MAPALPAPQLDLFGDLMGSNGSGANHPGGALQSAISSTDPFSAILFTPDIPPAQVSEP